MILATFPKKVFLESVNGEIPYLSLPIVKLGKYQSLIKETCQRREKLGESTVHDRRYTQDKLVSNNMAV